MPRIIFLDSDDIRVEIWYDEQRVGKITLYINNVPVAHRDGISMPFNPQNMPVKVGNFVVNLKPVC